MQLQQDLEKLYTTIAARLGPGGDMPVKSPRACNMAIFDTELAAILATLGIPLRDPVPFTDCIEQERRVRTWWFDERSESGHITEDILGGYYQRERMEKEHPLHPIVPMRSAIDQRKFWIRAVKEAGVIAREGQGFTTPSLHSASILTAHKFKPVAFTGRAFIIESMRDGMHAGELLAMAQQPEGATAPQWMRKVLINLDTLLSHMRKGSPIVRVQQDGRSMLLAKDADPKIVSKFENLL